MAAAIGFLPASVSAQDFTYISGVQVQNLSGSTANITLSFYATASGTLTTSANDTIGANSSKTYFGASMPVSSGFNGSMVVSADQPVAAISNILGNGGVASASYDGAAAGSTTLLLPLLMKGNSGNDTWFNIQNTGSSVATVNVAYSDGTNVNGVTINPGASHSYFQATETHPGPKVFSAIVTSAQALAGTVLQEKAANPALMFAYTGFNAGTTNPVMPLINSNNGGTITGVQIQNAGGSDTTVTVSYTPSLAGSACTETQAIPHGQSKTFALAAFANGANSNCAGGVKFVGTAKVTGNTASQPLTAIVNQLGSIFGEAYGAFNAGSATSKVVFPLIVQRSFDFSGISIMNVSGVDTNVSCTFSGSAFTVPSTLLHPNQAKTVLMTAAIGSNYVGSGTCTASGAGKLVGVANQLGKTLTGDQFLVYEGINQ